MKFFSKSPTAEVGLKDLAKAEEELGALLNQFAGSKDLAKVVHEVVEEYRNTKMYEEGRGLFAYLLENRSEGPDMMLELRVGIALQSIKLKDEPNTQAAIARLIADFNDNPNIAKGLFQIGEEYFYARKYAETVKLLELIDSNYPGRDFPAKSEVPYVLATCYLRRGNVDKAIENYERSLEKYPKGKFAPRACYRLGMVYMTVKKDYEQAVYWFDQQRLRYDDKNLGSKALAKMGGLYFGQLKDYGKAVECFEEYAFKYPDGDTLWGCLYELGQSHEMLGDTQKALAAYSRAYNVQTDVELRAAVSKRIASLGQGGAK